MTRTNGRSVPPVGREFFEAPADSDGWSNGAGSPKGLPQRKSLTTRGRYPSPSYSPAEFAHSFSERHTSVTGHQSSGDAERAQEHGCLRRPGIAQVLEAETQGQEHIVERQLEFPVSDN